MYFIKQFKTFCFLIFFIPIWSYYYGPTNISLINIAILIFSTGFLGTIFSYKTKNIIIFIMCIETMLLALVILFILTALFLINIQGQILALIILTLAAAETAIGLGLIVNSYKTHQTLDFVKFRICR